MQKIADLITLHTPSEKPIKTPPHALAAAVALIHTEIGFEGKYAFKYWLKQLKNTGIKSEILYTKMIGILKSLQNYDTKKYGHKGARLTNILKEL